MNKTSQHIRLTPKVVYDVFSTPSVEQYAISYARVSSEGQVDGYSLDIQKRECEAAALKLGTPIAAHFSEEGVSGTIVERPALSDALVYCAKNKGKIAYFIVKDIDRVARESLVYQMIKRQLNALGVQLYSINQPSISDQTPESKFLEGVFSHVAQLERDRIHARTVSGQKEAREQGAWIHAPPFGYVTTRNASGAATLAPHPERSKAIRKAFKLYAEGMDQEEICRQLNTLGYRTVTGGKLTKQTMSHLLRNPVYIGKIRDPKVRSRLIDGLHPALVSLENWRLTQDRINGRSPFPQRQESNPHFPLVNVLRCYICGGPMSGSFSRGKSKKRYGYYHCRTTRCRSKNVPHEAIEKQFEQALNSIEPTEACVKLFEEDFITVYREKWKQCAADKTVLERRLTDLTAKRDLVEDRFITGKISEDTYQRQLGKVQEELLQVSEAREDHILSESHMKEVMLFARRFLTSISNTWKNGTVEQKKLIQKTVFPNGLRLNSQWKLEHLELPPLLRLIANSNTTQSKMVGRVGLEPTTKSLRGSCSTN